MGGEDLGRGGRCSNKWFAVCLQAKYMTTKSILCRLQRRTKGEIVALETIQAFLAKADS